MSGCEACTHDLHEPCMTLDVEKDAIYWKERHDIERAESEIKDAEIARLRAELARANRPPISMECVDCGDVVVVSRVGEKVYCQCPGSVWSIQERKEKSDA